MSILLVHASSMMTCVGSAGAEGLFRSCSDEDGAGGGGDVFDGAGGGGSSCGVVGGGGGEAHGGEGGITSHGVLDQIR